jgi:putative phosphonate transport system ATP-binding protein
MVMQGGRVVEDGLTDQVLDDPRHAYTQMLVSSILPV